MSRKRTWLAFCIAIVLGLSTMISSTIYANEGTEDPVEIPKIAENNDQSVSNDTSNVEEPELPQEEQPQMDKEPKLEEDRNLELDEPLEANDKIDTSMVFVSNIGNDTNLGTKEKPLLTIEKAIETVDEGGTVAILSNLVLHDSIIISKNMKLLGMDTGSGKPVLTQNKEMTHMFVVEKAVVTFEQIHFSGAGIDNTCTYKNPFYGGAVYVKTDSKIDVHLCTFTEFEGYSGSAIFTDRGQNVNINVYNCNFENNIASLGGAAIGAETCFNYALRITESRLINNHGDYKGGAIRFSNGAINSNIGRSLFMRNIAHSNSGNAIVYLASSQNGTSSYIKPTDGAAFYQNGINQDGEIIYVQMNKPIVKYLYQKEC